MFTFSFFAVDAFVPLALTDVRGTSVGYAGAVITSVALAWSAAAWVQERLVRRTGPQVLVRTGFLLLALGITTMTVVVATSAPVALAFLAWILGGSGAGLLFAPLTASALAVAPEGGEGQVSSWVVLAETLGIALGTGFAGAVVGAGEDLNWTLSTALVTVFVIAAAWAVAGSVTASRIPRSVLVD
jgi:MFS family permease